MFSGIIEQIGEVISLDKEGDNLHIGIRHAYKEPLYIDQSIAHDGVCLTVVSKSDKTYVVTAIEETLVKSNLGELKIGNKVNLERAVKGDTRMDGHMVQGHVDVAVECMDVVENDGSWTYTFSLPSDKSQLVVEKGSICINGVSLTLINVMKDRFSVAIIPYTYEHTTFRYLENGTRVNLEFDIIGKYVARYLNLTRS